MKISIQGTLYDVAEVGWLSCSTLWAQEADRHER